MPIPSKQPKETSSDYLARCMSDSKMLSEYPEAPQRYAVCSAQLKSEKMSNKRISFDYDGVASTDAGRKAIKERLAGGDIVYIISARSKKSEIIGAYDGIIPAQRIYATGSNEAKVRTIVSLRMVVHYDNNKDVIDTINKNTNTLGKLWE
jgi:hypothetical protein